MSDPLYRTLVWLDVRLGLLFAVGLPLVLLVWAAFRCQGAILRLLGLYWKVSSLLFIALLLLVGNQSIGYPLVLLAQVLMAVVLWFWVDLNEELQDLPPWRALPLTLRIWRWCLTIQALASAVLVATALGCSSGGVALQAARCLVWRQPPQQLNGWTDPALDFVIGGDWNPTMAAFGGYLALLGYAVGLLQWLLVRLPRQGRVAGDF
ncbi:MAG: DUF3177 family protein [Cyanobacteriota bacterium]|nr:DUF3177 family protein [Cyanobacteriota bacterium]